MKQTEIDPYGLKWERLTGFGQSNRTRKRKNFITSVINRGFDFLILKEKVHFGNFSEVCLSMAVNVNLVPKLSRNDRARDLYRGKTAQDERQCKKLGYRTYDLNHYEHEWFERNKKMFKLVHECEHGEVWRSVAN